MKYTLKERIKDLKKQSDVIFTEKYKGMRFVISNYGGYWCGYINSTKNYDVNKQIPECPIEITFAHGIVIGFDTFSNDKLFRDNFAWARSRALILIDYYKKAPKRGD